MIAAHAHRTGLRLLIGFLLILAPVFAAASPESLEALLRSGRQPPGVSVSLLFEPVCGSGTRVALGDSVALPPASVQKIVTSTAALDLLGPDHRFTTRVRADQPVRGARLEGNLYLEGDGDPFLVSERMWLLAHDVAVTGLREVAGDLFVDAEVITDLQFIRAREETVSPYAAPVSRLAVNFNSLCFLVRPGTKTGVLASVVLDPFPVAGVKSISRVTTVGSGPTAPLIALRVLNGAREIWTLEGSIPVNTPPVRIYGATQSPAELAGGVFAGLLGEQGVTVRTVRVGKAPDGAAVIASLPSYSLGLLIRSMNLWSNNFMADLLLVDLGDSTSGSAGLARVRNWLGETVGMNPLPQIHDGSGLSPENRVSAAQIVRLLVWSHSREKIFPDLYASFPRPGGEGTLERRFQEGPAPGLRAKTGTLGETGVSSIAGYIDHPAAGRYAFCILQQASPDAGLAVSALRAREEVWLRDFETP